MYWRVAKLDPSSQFPSNLRREALVEGRTSMSGEVVQHHSDLLGFGVGLLCQAPYRMSEFLFSATFCNHQLPPSAQWLEAHQDPAHPSSLVLRVEALDAP